MNVDNVEWVGLTDEEQYIVDLGRRARSELASTTPNVTSSTFMQESSTL